MANVLPDVINEATFLRRRAATRSDRPFSRLTASIVRRPPVLLVLVAGALMASCERAGEPAAPLSGLESQPAAAAPDQSTAFASANVSGETVYRAACAHCHDSGVDGAPVTGDADSWSDRSPLWEAVLATHAQNGYLGMPAKGGVDSLPDALVSRATEYMLLRTFPDRPPDD